MADSQAKAIGDALRARIADVAVAVALEVQANLIEDCPVDTGNARANFVHAVGAPFNGEATDSNAQSAGQIAVLAYRFGDGDIHISNNVKYLKYLILGSSSQASAGWDLAAIERGLATVQALNDDVEVRAVGAAVSVTPRSGE